MTQYAFAFDGTRCTGCKTCEFACKDYYDLDTEVQFRKIYEVTGGETTKDENGYATTSCYSYYVSMSCNHCDNPACVKVCPTGAMHKDSETGLVTVEEGRCIGCGYCHMACPYNAPKVDREKGHSVKCSGCAERLADGVQPICVRACPARALNFGPVSEMEKLGEVANIAPLPSPTYTDPNFYILACADARPSGDKEAVVVNPLEVE
jgi:anaerobic dimethyl sulfoxide reductase subunit B (iron-sulfur subunit)